MSIVIRQSSKMKRGSDSRISRCFPLVTFRFVLHAHMRAYMVRCCVEGTALHRSILLRSLIVCVQSIQHRPNVCHRRRRRMRQRCKRGRRHAAAQRRTSIHDVDPVQNRAGDIWILDAGHTRTIDVPNASLRDISQTRARRIPVSGRKEERQHDEESRGEVRICDGRYEGVGSCDVGRFCAGLGASLAFFRADILQVPCGFLTQAGSFFGRYCLGWIAVLHEEAVFDGLAFLETHHIQVRKQPRHESSILEWLLWLF